MQSAPGPAKEVFNLPQAAFKLALPMQPSNLDISPSLAKEVFKLRLHQGPASSGFKREISLLTT